MLRISSRKHGRRGGRHQKVPAFTLAESLFGGGLAALVLAVIVPLGHVVRQRDNLAGCLANLHAIGQASRAYAVDDPNDLMIPVSASIWFYRLSGAIEWGGKAGRGQSINLSAPEESPFGTKAWRGPAHRPLNPYLYKGGFPDYNPFDGSYLGTIEELRSDANLDLGYYRCPADTGYAGGGFLYTASGSEYSLRNEPAFLDEGLTAYDHYGTSYMANTFFIVGGSSVVESQSPFLAPLSQIPTPAHTIAYEEVPARFMWLWGSWDEGTGEGSMLTCGGDISGEGSYAERTVGGQMTVPGWHGMDFHFNVCFADGHAATVRMQGCMRPSPNLGPDYYPPNPCGGCSDDYEAFKCITIRGPGWRLDTLPAPSVPTLFWPFPDRGFRDGSIIRSNRPLAHTSEGVCDE